jgi:hypothetical protein
MKVKILTLLNKDILQSVLLDKFFIEVTEDEDYDILLFLTRDILDWINDLYENIINVSHKSIKDFLYLPFSSGEEKNILLMRNSLFSLFLQEENKCKEIIKYEDLITNCEKIINNLKEKYKIPSREISFSFCERKTKETLCKKISFSFIFKHPDFCPVNEVKLGYFNYIQYFTHVNFSQEKRVKYYMGEVLTHVYVKKELLTTNIIYDNYCLVTKTSVFKEKTTYLSDLQTYMSTLFPHLDYNLICMFGDSMRENTYPCLSKARLVNDKNKKVLLRLNTNRHFSAIRDVNIADIPFQEKENKLIWRGELKTGKRKEIFSSLSLHFFREDVDIKGTNFLSVRDMLKYKFILSIEGNDVATNLKWALYSNSCVLMPKPRATSWIMEDELIPYIHFVPLKDDLSDIEEKYEWCLNNLHICEKIGQNGKKYMLQFLNEEKEKRVILQVLTSFMERVIIV